jgi:hypothetical protein
VCTPKITFSGLVPFLILKSLLIFFKICFARLYLGDAVHILLWLLALLVAIFAADLPFTSISQGALGLASILAIMELCLALKSRPPTNVTRSIIKR